MFTSRSRRLYKSAMLCLCATLMCYAPFASAQENSVAASEYQSATPKVVYLDNADGYNARSLTTTFYVSDDEIWYSGLADATGSYLIQANSMGDIIDTKTFLDAPGNYPVIQCISKVGDVLLLGFIDAEHQGGIIGLVGNNGNTTYISIRNDVKLVSMAPTAKGILAIGINFNEKDDIASLYSLHFSASGNLDFEKVIHTAKMSEDQHYLSTSIGCGLDDQYFIQLNTRAPGRMLAERLLICLNSAGSEQWRASLPENFPISRISASNDCIYLFGSWGDIDENGGLVNRRAAVMCYSVDGAEKWFKTFEVPDSLYFGASANGACVAATGREGPGTWYLSSINADGSIRILSNVDFSDDIHVRGVFTSPSGLAKILGTTDTQLFLFELPY